jgi:Uma2 family endonuclease
MSAALKLHDNLYEQLLALPDHVVGEIYAGEVHASPRPSLAHADTQGELNMELRMRFGSGGRGGGWVILTEPELHLNDDVLVPDVAAWRTERLPDARRMKATTIAPDWVCEIASPSTATRDRTTKRDAYARGGVRYLWLVEPDAELVEAFEFNGQHWVLLGNWSGDDVANIVPFEAADLKLSHLWGRPVPTPVADSGEL